MDLFPINTIMTQNDVLPVLIINHSESDLKISGLTQSDGVTYFIQNGLEGLLRDLPELETNRAFLFLLTGFEEDGTKCLSFVQAVQIEGYSAVDEELELQIYSQSTDGGEIVWNPLLSEYCPDTLLDLLKSIPKELEALQAVSQAFEIEVTRRLDGGGHG